jgi:hypothetical protein
MDSSIEGRYRNVHGQIRDRQASLPLRARKTRFVSAPVGQVS